MNGAYEKPPVLFAFEFLKAPGQDRNGRLNKLPLINRGIIAIKLGQKKGGRALLDSRAQHPLLMNCIANAHFNESCWDFWFAFEASYGARAGDASLKGCCSKRTGKV